MIMIDSKYLYHSSFDVAEYNQWRELHPDTEESIPSAQKCPQVLGPRVRITVYKDADHAHDILTR